MNKYPRRNPLCEAIPITNMWYINRGSSAPHCKHNANYKIDGRLLCTIHAGHYLLKLELELRNLSQPVMLSLPPQLTEVKC